ncbi:MAG: prephenate dehydrogenase/arogenate dehydrogenase family protein, partial [Nitrososphaerales archaeon]
MSSSIMNVTIIGAGGKMGAWFTNYFVKQKHRVFVHDVNKESLKKLKSPKISIANDLKFTLMKSDVVILCVPINSMKRVLLQVAKYMMIGATLMEISSIKYEAHKTLTEVAHMYKLKPLCVHPLFGPGAENIKGMKVALIPVLDARAELRNARKILRGASLAMVDVKDHDKIVALVLGLTHLINAILAKIMSDEREPRRFKEIAGSTYRLQSLLTESILNDEPELFTSLLMSNSYTKQYARNLLETTQRLCNYILNDNSRGLYKDYVKIRDKLSQQIDLEKSYQTMYEV